MGPKQKRPSPLDDPPSASDSESGDQEPQFVMHRQQHHRDDEEEEDEEASSEEEQENDEYEEDQVQPSPTIPPSNSNPKPSSSESEIETDSESESESESDPPVPNSKGKPLASKPMYQTPKTKPNTPSKRPAESNGHGVDTKRPKTKATESGGGGPSSYEAEEDVKKPGGDDSKKLFRRVFSEEDEIAILKGLAEFISKTGTEPYKNVDAFHEFVKNSLCVDATSNQLKEKVRRLKKKYETARKRGKNGEGPSFSKAHDQIAFELAKKVWGNDATAEGANGVVVEKDNNPKASGKLRKGPRMELKPESQSEAKQDLEQFDAPLALRAFVRFDRSGFELGEDLLKESMKGIEASKREELEKRWREILEADFDLSAKRAVLLAEQAMLISKGRR